MTGWRTVCTGKGGFPKKTFLLTSQKVERFANLQPPGASFKTQPAMWLDTATAGRECVLSRL